MEITKQEALPEQAWQKTAAFPDWKGYTDDTLAMNSMLSFRHYRGQGILWLSVSEEVERFALYVNGARFDTSAITPGVWSVDISGATVDGVNTLQVSNILPLAWSRRWRSMSRTPWSWTARTAWRASTRRRSGWSRTSSNPTSPTASPARSWRW